jgi:hypothetical protein
MGNKRMVKDVVRFITVITVMLIAASQFALFLNR